MKALNKYSLNFSRGSFARHFASECRMRAALCPVPNCDFRGRAHEMERHNNESTSSHLSLLWRSVQRGEMVCHITTSHSCDLLSLG